MTPARFVIGYGLTGLNILEFYWRLRDILGLEQASNHWEKPRRGGS